MSPSQMACWTARAAWCCDRPITACRRRWPACIDCSSQRSNHTDMIQHRSDHAAMIRALRNASPYIRLYKGKIFVVKAGGAVFYDAAMTRALIEQIAILHYLGVRVVMVHGGGPQLTELTDALGVTTRMVQGRRVTDEKSIDATAMVLNGLINTRILGICRDLEIDAVGLSGVDAGLVRAHRRAPMHIPGEPAPADFGFVGDIDSIDL